jgi:hypothetical protein
MISHIKHIMSIIVMDENNNKKSPTVTGRAFLNEELRMKNYITFP